MEWELRRLRERSQEHEHETDRHRGPGGRVLQQRAEAVGAAGLADHDEATQHRQPAESGDQQRLEGGGSCGGRRRLVPDEEERRDRRQLPEAVEHQEVVGEHQPEHRAGEEHQQTQQPGRRRTVRAEVAVGVGDDQHADAGDEADHDRRETVETQIDAEPELRDPLGVLGEHGVVDDVAQLGQQPPVGRRHRERGEGEGEPTAPLAGRQQREPDEEMEQEQRAHHDPTGGPLHRTGRRSTAVGI